MLTKELKSRITGRWGVNPIRMTEYMCFFLYRIVASTWVRITLEPLLSIPELLQFIEVLVQDVHLRRPHPCHPNYRGTSLAVFSPPGPYQPLLGLASQIWGFLEP